MGAVQGSAATQAPRDRDLVPTSLVSWVRKQMPGEPLAGDAVVWARGPPDPLPSRLPQ